MDSEPSVSWLPYFASPMACSIFTRAQSASSSSATIIGKDVRMPVPISERCAMMITRPSGSRPEINAGLPGGVAGGGSRCFIGKTLAAEDQRAGRENTAEETAAADYRIDRFSFRLSCFHPRCHLHGLPDALIRSAAADVALHGFIDIADRSA